MEQIPLVLVDPNELEIWFHLDLKSLIYSELLKSLIFVIELDKVLFFEELETKETISYLLNLISGIEVVNFS